jgi:phospholipid-binding lipoprotein MlaA
VDQTVRRWAGALAGGVGLFLIVGCATGPSGEPRVDQRAQAAEIVPSQRPSGGSEFAAGPLLLSPPPVRLVANKPAPPAPPPPADAPPEDPFYDPFAKSDENASSEEYDPWEPFNAKMFEFNRQLDRWVLKPAARGYNFVVPNAVQIGISNLFYNIRFPSRFLNNIFQGKWTGARMEVGRFLLNSSFGLGGLVDVAKYLDVTTPEEDTGQTLGYYGVKPGPYLVLPFLPPFTVRDFVGYLGDIALNPINWMVFPIFEIEGVPSLVAHHNRTTSSLAQIGGRGEEILNDRSLNLEKFQGVEEATLDLYTAVRNAYLQKRARAVAQ